MSTQFAGWNQQWYERASDEDKQSFRTWLSLMLLTQKMSVSFIKADGSTRDMKCTLSPALIPEDKRPEQNLTESEAAPEFKDYMKVFDLEKDAWRSFKLASVKGFSFVEL